MERLWKKHYGVEVPAEVEIPEISIPAFFQLAVEAYRDHPAITFFGRTITYEELHKKVLAVAGALYKRGLRKGDRVSIMLPNCPHYPISFFASLLCGATVVQTNPMYKPNELKHVLNDSGATYMIAYERFAPVVEAVKEDSDLSHVFYVSYEHEASFNDLLKENSQELPEPGIQPKEDVAVLQYTGGTTGRSKGAMLTHYNLIANAVQSSVTSAPLSEKGKERVLLISPLFHVYGMTSGMIMGFHNGSNLILIPKFEIEQVVKVIEELKPTIFPGVPTMYIALLNYAKKHTIDLRSFKICTSGSAPLPVEVLEKLKELTGAPIAEGYGLSEASPSTHRNPVAGLQKAGSIGIPFPNTDAKVVDADTGEELGINEVGELLIKGPQVMKGYWRMPEETGKTLQNGWLYTGDLAKMDEDGYFYIVGRKKELIIASGYNVYPVEIEDVLYMHPQVLEAAVIGVPDPYRGETIKAVIVPKAGETVTEEEIIQFASERLSTYKVPRIIEFIEEMPKSAVGKILKRELN